MDFKYFECSCNDRSHLIRMANWDNDYVYVETALNHNLNFLQRIYVAICFIFNWRELPILEKLNKVLLPLGCYTETLWDLETVCKLIVFLNQFKEDYLKQEEELQKEIDERYG